MQMNWQILQLNLNRIPMINPFFYNIHFRTLYKEWASFSSNILSYSNVIMIKHKIA